MARRPTKSTKNPRAPRARALARSNGRIGLFVMVPIRVHRALKKFAKRSPLSINEIVPQAILAHIRAPK